MLFLIQRASHPKLSTGAVTAFGKLHLLLSETKITTRGYFRAFWTVVYQFWAPLIWVPKIDKAEKKICESKQTYFV